MTSLVLSMLNQVSDRFNEFRARSNKRGLIHQILSLQILITGAIGVVAIASLYWGGQWVLQDNYSRWALQWTEELNELGAPLYLQEDDEVVLRLESFVAKYPEIGRVTYYRDDGEVLNSIANESATDAVDGLSDFQVQEAKALIGEGEPYLIDSSIMSPRQFEILAPVWTESIGGDGLFAFDIDQSDNGSSFELRGFVGLHLDFALFHDRLLENIKTAVLVLFFILVASALYGRHALRKALMSITDLQEPLEELAKGNLAVKFKPAEHREISEIVEALETTTRALGERDAKLLKLANHDVLTGLFNRRRFVEELKKELGSVSDDRKQSSLLFIDLDQFKYVNDACGHPAGDRLIRKVAELLKRGVGDKGLVARFGGDEFVVLAKNTNRSATKILARSILEDMRRLAHIEGDRVFHIHCSIGITMISGAESDHDDLVAQADNACREAKSAGRNRLQFFSMSEDEAERQSADVGWMTKLRDALDQDLFELRYQPIVCISTGNTTHHEVLLRLPGENGKVIGPDAFLPAAVRFGLMAEIDSWMIKRASMAYAEHSKNNPRLKLSVNLSANAFETEDLAAYVKDCFTEYAVPPHHVIFEITESLAVRHHNYVESQITALRKMGCELALDDFGTGYSSFSYLQRLEVDYIKIDGSFIRDLVKNPVDQKMVRLIAEIGREAGMKTVAEYVQSGPALVLLNELGVDLAQGYFIGRPARTPLLKSMPVPLHSRRKQRQLKENFSA
jgi:diguanylate cyclase (GGDEF)-like protein